MYRVLSFKSLNAGSTRTQSGAAMMEALIGSLLLGIIMVGINTALSKTLVGQRYMNAQNIVILGMHNRFQDAGIEDMCGGTTPASITLGGQSIAYDTPNCQSAAVTVAINSGLSISLASGNVQGTSFSLSTDSTSATQSLFGGTGVVSVSY